MKNNVFGEIEWSKSFRYFTGLPRPFSKVLKKHRVSRKLAYKVPIPWQSEAVNNDNLFLKIIQENEDIIYYKDLCSYCGIKINNDDNVARWKNKNLQSIRHDGSFVFSDIHPLHLECMKQTRIYCPGMRKIKEEEFEYGSYLELNKNANKEREYAMNFNIENLTNVFYFTADWCQPCKNVKPIIKEINRDRFTIKFQIIDADIEKELVKKFEIKSLPTFIIISKGKEIKRLVGAQNKNVLEDFLNYADQLKLDN